jgi:hypothetical protein
MRWGIHTTCCCLQGDVVRRSLGMYKVAAYQQQTYVRDVTDGNVFCVAYISKPPPVRHDIRSHFGPCRNPHILESYPIKFTALHPMLDKEH